MRDALDGRTPIDGWEPISADFIARMGGSPARPKREDADPLPIVGRAMALILAVSLTSLSIGATIV